MDLAKLKEVLTTKGRRELGIPVVLPSISELIFPLAQWSLEGSAMEGRQVWFCVGNADELKKQLPSQLRNRILPIPPSCLTLLFERGPFDALLLPKHGFWYSDPNLLLSDFWKVRGVYEPCSEGCAEDWTLWLWTPKQKTIKLFAMDHHHAVLWDAMKILRPLGIQVDFHWLCDGRPPVNEALPSELPGFQSSLDIYKTPVHAPLSDAFKECIRQGKYDGVLTSHSLVTCYRLRELGLPMFHINSTRFGNEWIQDPGKHETLVKALHDLFQQDRLRVIHNNKGDVHYFHQYFPSLSPRQEITIPSLCESAVRLRRDVPVSPKLLIWDTRQVLLQQDGSPFMKQLFHKTKQAWGDKIESQAILMAQAQAYLPEGYLDAYTAVIHIPYNVSTMSMFQHVRSNIPIWIPSKRLLAELWANPNEPNELSWTVFAAGTEANASAMDKVRDPKTIQRWIESCDFYDPDVLPLCFQFDSIEELVEKGLSTDYQSAMNKTETEQQTRRENITFAWEQAILGGLKG